MKLGYQPAPTPGSTWTGDVYLLVLQACTAYVVVSVLTLPFLDKFWIAEVPLLALVQLPKTSVAGWLRTHVVMPTIQMLGFSRGSFSPDYVIARPYALAITYLVSPGIVIAIVWWRRRLKHPYRRWVIILLIVAALDFLFTLRFGAGPGLAIY